MTRNELLTTTQAAMYLCVSRAFLERDRWQDTRIPYVRVGKRAVRYRLSDLDAYLARQTYRNAEAK